MTINTQTKFIKRRIILQSLAGGLLLCAFPLQAQNLEAKKPLKIGVIGSGNVGGTVGELWVKAGHEVMFASRNLDDDKVLAARIGGGVKVGTPKEAAVFGEVLFFAVPYAALPALGRDLAAEIKGKIILDACNPIPSRDGDMANEALAKGTGVSSPQFLSGARIVRVYSHVGYLQMKQEAHRSGERLGISIAGDDAEAIKVAQRLVNDAGHEPVLVGGLARAKEFDYRTPVFGKPMTAKELRRAFNL
ncbi:MAG: NAD(P)-binding domain-containing protein [Burkholderiales bacterium]